MHLNLCVVKSGGATQRLVLALKLHCLQLLLHLFLDADEAWLLALHGALASLLCKLVETDLVEPFLALLALPGLDENG